MKHIISTLVLIGLCFFLTAYSHGYFVVKVIPILLIISALATLLTSIWIKGDFWKRQIKASKIAFPVSAIIFIIGYFCATLSVMI